MELRHLRSFLIVVEEHHVEVPIPPIRSLCSPSSIPRELQTGDFDDDPLRLGFRTGSNSPMTSAQAEEIYLMDKTFR